MPALAGFVLEPGHGSLSDSLLTARLMARTGLDKMASAGRVGTQFGGVRKSAILRQGIYAPKVVTARTDALFTGRTQ